MVPVAARDGWESLFMAVLITGDIAVLPMLCLIILPAWLVAARVPEFQVVGSRPISTPSTEAPAKGETRCIFNARWLG